MVSSCRTQFFWRALVTCAHVIQRCRLRLDAWRPGSFCQDLNFFTRLGSKSAIPFAHTGRGRTGMIKWRSVLPRLVKRVDPFRYRVFSMDLPLEKGEL